MKNKRKSDNPVENDFSNNKTITQHKNNINNATNNSTKSDFKNVLFKNKGPTEVFNKSDRIIFKRSSLSLKSNQIYSSRRMSKLSSDKTLDANEEKIHKRNNIKTNNVNFRGILGIFIHFLTKNKIRFLKQIIMQLDIIYKNYCMDII